MPTYGFHITVPNQSGCFYNGSKGKVDACRTGPHLKTFKITA
jgi:hypothetical protein